MQFNQMPETAPAGDIVGGSIAAKFAEYAVGQATQVQQPETELAYAARAATESLQILERAVQELAARLQVVLAQDTPSPANASGSNKARRSVSSQIANALLAHSEQTDAVTNTVRNLLHRIVL